MGVWVVPVWGNDEWHCHEHSRMCLWMSISTHYWGELHIFSFSRHCPVVFQRGGTKLYCQLQCTSMKTYPWWFLSFQTLWWACVGCKLWFLISISLEVKVAEPIFICLLAIWILSLRMSVQVSACFLLGYPDDPFFHWWGLGDPTDHLGKTGKEEWHFVQGQR